MKRLLLIALCSLNLFASDDIYRINDKAFFIPHELGEIEFYMHDNNLIAFKGNMAQVVQPYNIDKSIRSFDVEKLNKFLEVGYISINENDHGELSLTAHVRGLGGGPGLGFGLYWTVKAIGYTAVLGTAMIVNVMAPGVGGIAIGLAGGAAGMGGIALAIETAASSAGTIGWFLPWF